MPPSFVRQLRNHTSQSDGTTVKLGAQILAAAAARVPSANKHIPLISALRTNVRSGVGVPTHNCNKVAISLAQGANITVAKSNNITHTLRAYHLHCLAARVPSFKLHIPCIRTLRIGVRSGVGVPPITATKLQYHLRKAQISLLQKATISRTLCVHITCIAVAARTLNRHIPFISAP